MAGHSDYQFAFPTAAQSSTIYGEIGPILSSAINEIQTLLAILGYRNDMCKRVYVKSLITIWKNGTDDRLFVIIRTSGQYGEACDRFEGCVFMYTDIATSAMNYEYKGGKLIGTDERYDEGSRVILDIPSAPRGENDLYAPQECCPHGPNWLINFTDNLGRFWPF